MARPARKTPSGGRGSAEAIEKRKVARQLNTLLSGQQGGDGKLDGRTEKRRQRLLKELKSGRKGKPLKPIELMTNANELMSLGETIASIRKSGFKLPKGQVPIDEESLNLYRRAQTAYLFRPDVWKLIGVDIAPNPPAKPRKATRKAPARKAASRKK